jgi:hypothetical protein
MKSNRRILWTALVGLSVGAVMLHYKIHPPSGGWTYLLANTFTWLNLVLVSVLFLFRGTAVWGLLLNSFIAFMGIIMMADYSIEAWLHGWIKVNFSEQPINWLLETTFPDIAILVAHFLVGVALYNTIMGIRKDLA